MGALQDMIEEDARRALSAIGSSTAAERAARVARNKIRARTRQGKSKSGADFASYAPSTAERKGRFSPVTLQETGKMLRSLSIRELGPQDADRDPRGRGSTLRGPSGRFVSKQDVRFGATVNIQGSRNRRIARYHIKGTRKMPRRDFFGLTKSEKGEVRRVLDRGMKRTIERALPDDRRRRVELKLIG